MSPVLTLTYSDTFSAVTVTVSSLAASVDTVTFERSIDQVHWSPVRGGASVAAVSNAASVTDYEFSAGVPNYYRATAVDISAPSFLAAGTSATANNASVTPALPAGQGSTWGEGDLLLVWGAIRNAGTGSVNVPTGYSVIAQQDNWGLFGKRASASESAPTVTITAGATGADVIAQTACFRNLDLVPAASAYQKNPSAANITYPGLFAFTAAWDAILYLGWRQSSWTSVATLAGAIELGDISSSLGSGAGLVWDYLLTPTAAPVASGAFVVTGGSVGISYGVMVALQSSAYVTRTVAAITPYMVAVWLKVPEVPYLNRSITMVDWSDNARTARTATYAIHAQRDATAYQDVASPRTVTLHVWADSVAELQAIELVLTVGNVVFVHTPPNVAFQPMYGAVGNYSYARPSHRSVRALIKVPLTEVVMPDISIVGNLVTYAALLTNYADYAATLAANATYQAILNLRGQPIDALWTM